MQKPPRTAAGGFQSVSYAHYGPTVFRHLAAYIDVRVADCDIPRCNSPTLGGTLLPNLAGIAQQIEGTENGPAFSITLLYQQASTASDVPQDFGHAELASQVRADQVDDLSWCFVAATLAAT